MDCCSQPGLLPLEDALVRMRQQLLPVQGTESVPLAQALDRVLASGILASINVPASDNSAMDGYALRSIDVQSGLNTFEVIGESLAGHPFNVTGDIQHLSVGQAVRIMTGAMIPAGADAVVMQENIQRIGNHIHIKKTVVCNDNIRRAGEDIRQGSEVLVKGHRINALDIGLLASLGITQVNVVRKLRVAILSTGDELLMPGVTHSVGKIYDSNRPLLLALLQRLAVDIKDIGIVADEPVLLRDAFTTAADWADVVISTGGVSVGDADYTRTVLAEIGKIDFWKIAIKPGKPFAFGKLGKGWFFGLPGNPVATAVTYHQLVVPALRYLSGEVETTAIHITAIAGQRFKKHPGRMDFQRGILRNVQGVNQVGSAGSQSSGVLSGMANANCYVCLEEARTSVDQGEVVNVIPFDRFIS
ncbi:gephyrin-like molybdotransferase Glp [Cellvibrio sp. UBA7661]|uniref:molybdopterin molybdotransferase MoeA n=1 Tax=Cellvibrio sp. UBA7661 TaxID=1946311 RepID=UPI002F35C7E9